LSGDKETGDYAEMHGLLFFLYLKKGEKK